MSQQGLKNGSTVLLLITMKAGQMVDISKRPHLMMGLGWTSACDLAAGVLLFDSTGAYVEPVDWRRLKSEKFRISHSGDVVDGASHSVAPGEDTEMIKVDLTSVTDNITCLLFCATIWTGGMNWSNVDSCYIRMVDRSNPSKPKETEHFKLDRKTMGTESRAMILGKIFRKSPADPWRFMSIGEGLQGLSNEFREPRKLTPRVQQYISHLYSPKSND